MFKRPFSVTGRIRRKEYGFSLLISFGILLAFAFCLAIFRIITNREYDDEFFTAFGGLFWWLTNLCFVLPQGAKRAHDMGHSGWFLFIPFYTFYIIFAEGNKGDNKYGKDPKEQNIICNKEFNY